MKAKQAARALGWFSIGLGAAEILFSRKLARMVGVDRRSGLVRLFGLREIAAGLAILGDGPRARWLWARVAGDAMDLVLLSSGVISTNARKVGAWVALANVGAVTGLDILTARRLPA